MPTGISLNWREVTLHLITVSANISNKQFSILNAYWNFTRNWRVQTIPLLKLYGFQYQTISRLLFTWFRLRSSPLELSTLNFEPLLWTTFTIKIMCRNTIATAGNWWFLSIGKKLKNSVPCDEGKVARQSEDGGGYEIPRFRHKIM